jgi:antagonist of KipI
VEDPIRILEGPDGRTGAGFDATFWSGRTFRVGPQSDRMGLRLEGEPVRVVHAPDRLSTPVAPGTIQVAGGQLIVLGVACGTMGGYPHIAQVISADLKRVAQLKPGDLIAFQLVALAEARMLDSESRSRHKALVNRLRLLIGDEPGLRMPSRCQLSSLSLPDPQT